MANEQVDQGQYITFSAAAFNKYIDFLMRHEQFRDNAYAIKGMVGAVGVCDGVFVQSDSDIYSEVLELIEQSIERSSETTHLGKKLFASGGSLTGWLHSTEVNRYTAEQLAQFCSGYAEALDEHVKSVLGNKQ